MPLSIISFPKEKGESPWNEGFFELLYVFRCKGLLGQGSGVRVGYLVPRELGIEIRKVSVSVSLGFTSLLLFPNPVMAFAMEPPGTEGPERLGLR